ncbi:hypothetical protein AOLI_G00066890 [Acnodon oligacanthus]
MNKSWELSSAIRPDEKFCHRKPEPFPPNETASPTTTHSVTTAQETSTVTDSAATTAQPTTAENTTPPATESITTQAETSTVTDTTTETTQLSTTAQETSTVRDATASPSTESVTTTQETSTVKDTKSPTEAELDTTTQELSAVTDTTATQLLTTIQETSTVIDTTPSLTTESVTTTQGTSIVTDTTVATTQSVPTTRETSTVPDTTTQLITSTQETSTVKDTTTAMAELITTTQETTTVPDTPTTTELVTITEDTAITTELITTTQEPTTVQDTTTTTELVTTTEETSTVPDTTTTTTELIPTTQGPTTVPDTTTTTTGLVTTTEDTTQLPTTTTTTAKTTTTTTTTMTTQAASSISLSLRLNEAFDLSLQDPSSAKYQQYKSQIEAVLMNNYRNIPGFRSVSVTGFRSGSVIVEFSLQLDPSADNSIITSDQINQDIKKNLQNSGFQTSDDAVSQSEETTFRDASVVYPGDDMVLTCNPSGDVPGTVQWRAKGTVLQDDSHYVFSAGRWTLTVKGVTPSDNGRYECQYSTSSGLHVLWDNIDYIKPYPNIQTNPNRSYQCQPSNTVQLRCCVYVQYDVQLENDKGRILTSTEMASQLDLQQKCIQYSVPVNESCGSTLTFFCRLTNGNLQKFSYSSRTVEVKISAASAAAVTCNDDVYGFGNVGDTGVGKCNDSEVGSKTAKCGDDGKWKLVQNNCVLRVFQMLKEESQDLDTNSVKQFVINVANATQEHMEKVVTSPGTIATIITLLNTIADVSQSIQVDQVVIQVFLQTLDVITSSATQNTWNELNNRPESKGNSSLLLMSLENIIKSVSSDVSNFTTNTTDFRKATISNEPFNQTFGNDSTATIFIPNTTLTTNITITSVAFFNLSFILPPRNNSVNETSGAVVNGITVLVSVSKNDSIHNTTLTFRKLNATNKLANADCVFWNFVLLDDIGGWDSSGCKRKSDLNGVITCECNHTTSFSVLMSPAGVDSIPLSIITYVGVAVSMASLVLFLLVEAIFWKPITRGSSSPILYLRHVSLVNIAVSLLIANIWFIIGAAISESAPSVPINPCSAAAFFIHFFYLALFFWMLVSALLLLYSILVVFSRMSKSAMMTIAFCVGYGAPLIISVVTVASTAGGGTYITEEGACWLNWKESKAQLAFIIPALAIVFINFLVMVVVLYKMLRRRVGERSGDEKNAMAVIARFVVVLTPVFGITWGFGLGLMISPESLVLHYLFAILNSLQGFFIAVLGTLFDKKLLKTVKQKLRIGSRSSGTFTSTSTTNRTGSTAVI